MPPTNFPLRWESTGDQWWFASPIDWAAANGHYDVVRELLHIDPNLLIKLTSLPRLRRLETVWDDSHQGFRNVARCRALVAYKLLQECETGRGDNSLIRAGYGGWLLYTAAAAGDAVFVKELLDREPCLVFGEGEYGVTDVLYAAARSRNGEVFRMLFECCLSPRGSAKEVSPVFRLEMVNRAVHAAARGGNVEILKELLGENGDALAYWDGQGSTVLHSAAGRGQVEVVRYLISTYDIVDAVDSQGNTALSIAGYHGHPAVVEALVSALPRLASMANSYGDTVLHMAVSGFCAPNFRRIDRQRELMKRLVDGKLMNVEDVINLQNKDGRTALHLAVIGSVQSDIVELLMSVRYIDFNLRDANGNTPLDLLKQRPPSASSEILIKRLISAGGMSDCRGHTARKALVSHLKTHGIGGSPGTSFMIPDAEIFLHSGVDNPGMHSGDISSSEYGYSSEIQRTSSTVITDSPRYNELGSMNRTSLRLKTLFNKWHRKKDKSTADAPDLGEGLSSIDSGISRSSLSSRNVQHSLRMQFSRVSSLPNNKRVSLFPCDLPSPSTRRKFAAELSHGVLQVIPKPHAQSPSSPLSESAWSSPVRNNNSNSVHHRSGSSVPSVSPKKSRLGQKHRSFNMRVINDFLCFGSQGKRVQKLVGSRPVSREEGSSVDGQ